MTTTDFLAIWGAIVSTVAVVWNVFRDLNDRTKLSVRVSISRMVPDPTNRDYLVVTMTNIGRRPVMIKSWGAEFAKKSEGKPFALFIPRQLPKLIAESEYHMEWSHDLQSLRPEIKSIFVVDSSDKHWKAPKKDVKRVIRDLIKIKQEPRPSS